MKNRKKNQVSHDQWDVEKQAEYSNIEPEQEEKEIIRHQTKMKKSIWLGVLSLIGLSIIAGFYTTGYMDEGTAEEVVFNRISEATVAGEQLFEEETNAGIEARDFEVTGAGTDGGEARMLIWDFNMEDLDEVSIIVDGTVVREKHIITNDAYAISVPVPSVVTITGVTDRGAGISYAVKFPNNEQTYFNVVAPGQSNTYTVLPSP
ncbi:hypothetical protein ACQKMN_02670 [Ureibacillus composti]